MMQEKNRFTNAEGFDLSFVVNELQKTPNAAIKKMSDSGKRPIRLIEDYLDTIIKNDSLLVKQLLRICLSAYTNEPINAGILAPSSEGKTYATVEVSEIFPKEDVIAVGRMSPTALIHQHGELVDSEGNPIKEKIEKIQLAIFEAEKSGNRSEAHELKQIHKDMMKTARNLVDLTHKILLLLDNPSPQTYEMLKPILSHDKREILYKTTKSDGSLTVKETIIRGWPATIICSAKNEAKNEVWTEIASREIILSPNTDVSKYHAANKFTSMKMGMPTLLTSNHEEKTIVEFHVARLRDSLQRLSKNGNNPVFNPFAEKMADLFPHNEGITMRHFKRLLSFVNIETLINAHSNMKIEYQHYSKKEKQIFIVTSLKSIANAIEIVGNISTVAPEKIKFYNEVFVPLIKEKYSVQAKIGEQQNDFKLLEDTQALTANEIAEKVTKVFHKPMTPKQVQENYLKPLTDEGILEWKQNSDNKRQYLYFVSSKLTVNNFEEMNRQLIDIVDNHFGYIWSYLVKPFQSSTKSGKMIRMFDDENPRISYLEFKKKISGSIMKSIDNQCNNSGKK